jgi:AcrR family transcriptional regulator
MFDSEHLRHNCAGVKRLKTKSVDRRTQRTDKLLREALVVLILEKRYDAITVQDILDRANVGRSTFYAHYYDKDDLLESNIEWLIDTFTQPLDGTRGGHAHAFPSVEFFQHVQSQYALYEALEQSKAAAMLFRKAQTYLTATLQAHLESVSKNATEIPIPFLANYFAGSFITTLWWWLENKMPYSPEQMEAMFRALAMPSIERVMGAPSFDTAR